MLNHIGLVTRGGWLRMESSQSRLMATLRTTLQLGNPWKSTTDLVFVLDPAKRNDCRIPGTIIVHGRGNKRNMSVNAALKATGLRTRDTISDTRNQTQTGLVKTERRRITIPRGLPRQRSLQVAHRPDHRRRRLIPEQTVEDKEQDGHGFQNTHGIPPTEVVNIIDGTWIQGALCRPAEEERRNESQAWTICRTISSRRSPVTCSIRNWKSSPKWPREALTWRTGVSLPKTSWSAASDRKSVV
uniref:Transposase n=1 Tax=Steinernema glaseri TaxID=37863 RepID=A0A1I7ZF23_9BILA